MPARTSSSGCTSCWKAVTSSTAQRNLVEYAPATVRCLEHGMRATARKLLLHGCRREDLHEIAQRAKAQCRILERGVVEERGMHHGQAPDVVVQIRHSDRRITRTLQRGGDINHEARPCVAIVGSGMMGT